MAKDTQQTLTPEDSLQQLIEQNQALMKQNVAMLQRIEQLESRQTSAVPPPAQQVMLHDADLALRRQQAQKVVDDERAFDQDMTGFYRELATPKKGDKLFLVGVELGGRDKRVIAAPDEANAKEAFRRHVLGANGQVRAWEVQEITMADLPNVSGKMFKPQLAAIQAAA